MLDTLVSRIFGSYKTTFLGIFQALAVGAATTIQSGHWNNGTFITASIPLVIGAT